MRRERISRKDRVAAAIISLYVVWFSNTDETHLTCFPARMNMTSMIAAPLLPPIWLC